MGIADRDYMRERNRRTFDDLVGDRDRPFAPARQSSPVASVFFWAFVGFLLFLGFQLYQEKRQAERIQHAASVVVPAPRDNTEDVRRRTLDVPTPVREPERREPPAMSEPAGHRAAAPIREGEALKANVPSTGGTLYLCKSYDGGIFWAQTHCNQHRALIDSMVSVPAGMPFGQQVELAQQRRQALVQTISAAPAPAPTSVPASSNKAECEALDRRVESLDGMARQPQSAQVQDWIRGERKTARDWQFALRC